MFVARQMAKRKEDWTFGQSFGKVLWAIFDRVRAELKARHLITEATLFNDLAAAIAKSGKNVFDFAVIDEAQDISISHLRFLAALGANRPDALFFAGDPGQRIFQLW
jgi:superfamily I DNA/RNA helicase